MANSAGILEAATTTAPFHAKLTNGARIEARSFDNPQSMYGPTIRGAHVDEFGQITAEAYAAMSSRRAESIGWGEGYFRYTGNVGEVGGAAEEIWQNALDGRSGFAYRSWTWKDRALAYPCSCDVEDACDWRKAKDHSGLCLRRPYLGFISNEASRMSPAMFRALYGAEWLDFNLLPAYDYDREIHMSDEWEYDPELQLHVSCDFNVDPMAWVLGHVKGNQAWAFDEIIIEGGARTIDACQEVIRRYPDRKTHMAVFGDRSGNSRDTRSKRTDYDQIRDLFRAHYHSVDMRQNMANPPVTDRINAFNTKLRAADGTVSYGLHSRCKRLARDLGRVSLKPGTRDLEKTKDKSLTHPSDADGYRIEKLFPVRSSRKTAVGRSTVTAVFRDNDAVLGERF